MNTSDINTAFTNSIKSHAEKTNSLQHYSVQKDKSKWLSVSLIYNTETQKFSWDVRAKKWIPHKHRCRIAKKMRKVIRLLPKEVMKSGLPENPYTHIMDRYSVQHYLPEKVICHFMRDRIREPSFVETILAGVYYG